MDKIIVLFHGGLGNQLYQYCFYRWLQNKFSDKRIFADISEYKVLECHQGFEMFKVFPQVNIDIAGNRDLFKIYGEIPRIYRGYGKYFIENRVRKPLNNKFFKVNTFNLFEEEILGETENVIRAVNEGKKYFSGYWTNKEYFLENEISLLRELRFKKIENEKNRKFIEMVKNSRSVSIHVRRGDYIMAGLPLVEMDYYQRAVELICRRVKNPVFFLFSDDKDFIGGEFGWLKNKIIIDSNIRKDSYIDMQLMSYCEHNILANSTFSTWAALLNDNNNKIVIYPKQNNYKRMMLDNWLMIK